MRNSQIISRSRCWRHVAEDALLALYVAMPIAILVFVILRM